MSEKNLSSCTAFCPVCGSDLCFAEDGCYCKGSFRKDSKCSWTCVDCKPRASVAK